MNCQCVYAVYFSATGRTKTVVSTIAQATAKTLGVPCETIDFTLPAAREGKYSFGETDLVIFGTPTYAGRVPNRMLPYVQTGFVGNGAFAVPVVLFGNRSFDNSLMELRNELENAGFHTVAGAAYVGQHAFSDVLAVGRPNAEDLAQAERFGEAVATKVQGLTEAPEKIAVKGEDPVGPYYTPRGLDGNPTVFLKAKPKTDTEKCVNCGVCAAGCPVGSIDPNDVTSVTGICIKCHACIRHCPTGAKYLDDAAFLSHKGMLERDFLRTAQIEEFI